MMTRILLICILIITSVTLNAQTSYQITNSVTLKNQDCELTKTTIILPVPQSNNYQEIANFKYSSGEVLDVENSNNQYLRNLKTSGLPSKGDSYSLTENFHITLYPMYIDMKQFKKIYPYNTQSEIYKRYTTNKGEYIDTGNARIKEISDNLWNESKGNIIDYARLCYEHVGANYKYLNPNTGIHKIATILSAGGGDCGNLGSIFVNLLRAKQIPARHIVTVRPNGTFHVWADFYLEKYGWIPVDANMKLDHPEGDYFGYCRGDGIVMSEDVCHPIEPEPGQTFNTAILQNFLYWYWYNAGTKVMATHHIEGKPIQLPTDPVVSDIGSSKVTLEWKDIKGATDYRIKLYEKDGKTLIQTKNVKATKTHIRLKNMKPMTEYTIQLIPIRQGENIETQMDIHNVHFKTV